MLYDYRHRLYRRLNHFGHVVNLWVRNPTEIRRMRAWQKTQGRTPLQDKQPWITFSAREWLHHTIHEDMNVFEFGSGGSTLYFASHVKRVVSVEHDSQWHAKVLSELSRANIENVDYFLFEPVVSPNGGAEDVAEMRYASVRFHDPLAQFTDYVQSIDRYEDRFFDVVLLDGRARNACAKHAIQKIRPGGFLVLDNSDRSDYEPIEEAMRSYRRMEFSGLGPYIPECWKTSVWVVDDA